MSELSKASLSARETEVGFISSVASNNSEQFKSSSKSGRSETKLERCAANFVEEDSCKRLAGEVARRIHSSNLLMMMRTKTAELASLTERNQEEEEDFARQAKETPPQRKEASEAPQMEHANEHRCAKSVARLPLGPSASNGHANNQRQTRKSVASNLAPGASLLSSSSSSLSKETFFGCQMRAEQVVASRRRRQKQSPEASPQSVSTRGACLMSYHRLIVACILLSCCVACASRFNPIEPSKLNFVIAPSVNSSSHQRPPGVATEARKEGNLGDEESERIHLRHNFTFRVNGRELALEPPAVSSVAVEASAAPAKKVNRLGESAALVDYESGFEPLDASAASSQSTGFEAASQQRQSWGGENYAAAAAANNKDRDSSTAPHDKNKRKDDFDGSSSSSGGRDRNRRRNVEQDLLLLAAAGARPTRNQPADGKQSRIISEQRAKSAGAAAASDRADRHSSAPFAAKDKRSSSEQLGAKFSALLSSKPGANELDAAPGAQSGESSTQSQASVDPLGRFNGANNNDSGEPEERNDDDKPLLAATSERRQKPLTGRAKGAQSSPARKASEKKAAAEDSAPAMKSKRMKQANGSRTAPAASSQSTASWPQRDAAPTAAKSSWARATKLTSDEGASAPNSTSSIVGAIVYEIPTVSISEHATNFSHATAQSWPPAQNGAPIGTRTSKRDDVGTKSSIVQRDLARFEHLAPSLAAADSAPSLKFAQAARPPNSSSDEQPPATTTAASLGQTSDSLVQPTSGREPPPSILGRSDESRSGGIVRTGPIHLPRSFNGGAGAGLSALVPAAMALLARANEDQQSRSAALRFLHQQHQQQQQQQQPQHQLDPFAWLQHFNGAPPAPAPQVAPSATPPNLNLNLSDAAQLFGADQMLAAADQVGVAHAGAAQNAGNRLQASASEPGGYLSAADYAERAAAEATLAPTSAYDGAYNAGSMNVSGDEQRYAAYAGAEYPLSESEPQRNHMQQQQQQLVDSQQTTNSRSSSMSEPFVMRSDRDKATPGAGAAGRSQLMDSASSGYSASLRNSLDPFVAEELASTGGLSSSDYERDLADLDEEFSRHRRPIAGSLLADSAYMSAAAAAAVSPAERYEARRFNARRPLGASYELAGYGAASDYLGTSIIPRPSYSRPATTLWSSAASSSPYAAAESDLWSDTSFDYQPLTSHHYAAYRWRPPRYQRVSAAYPGYLVAAASAEQPLQAGYGYLPAGAAAYSPAAATAATAPLQPTTTETISFALSPLAAAAAAAASALAAADKSRPQSHAWLTLPRLVTSAAASTSSSQNQATSGLGASSPTTSASSQHASAVPASLPAGAAAYLSPHRPGPYALSPIPIFAFAPRTPATALAASGSAAASGAPTAIYPYFHTAAPTLLAYRTATGMLPAGSLLTAASFGYPFRLPITAPAAAVSAATIGRSPIPLAGASNKAQFLTTSQFRPYLTDLQYAETKFNKSNQQNNSNSDSKSGFARSSSALSAMAKSLSKKVFGSASQLRPQHVAPPTNSGYELFSASLNTTLGNLSRQ